LSELCAARAAGDPERYPAKALKSARPRRFGAAYVGLRAGRTALVRRPAKGLLGGMLALPTGPWRAEPAPDALIRDEAPMVGAWRDMGTVEHVFTHFALSLRVFACEPSDEPPGAIWTPNDTALASMPSAFRKALAQALQPDRVSAARARTTSIPTPSSIRNDP
jgi:A/G-specific adenine glycosylase